VVAGRCQNDDLRLNDFEETENGQKFKIPLQFYDDEAFNSKEDFEGKM
jgi:hypothetical protein